MPRVAEPARTNTRVRSFRVTRANGTLLGFDDEAILTPTETNRQTLLDRAGNAIAANNAYIAKPAPTAAEQTAQILLLTRECSALIRLMLDRIEAAD